MRLSVLQENRSISVLISVLLMGTVAACSSSTEISPETQSKPLTEHEKHFDPGAFRTPEADTVKVAPPPVKEEVREEWVEKTEKTMGYRIQLFSTTSIDDAQTQVSRFQHRLDSMQVASGRLDITFDAPYYKVRMGDFLHRPPADSLRALLRERGLQEAWVVRDRVIRIIRVRK